MKLQITGHQVRLRIDEDELELLRSDGTLSGATPLPAGASFGWHLQLHAGLAATLVADGAHWRIGLPATAVDAYVERLPCKQGLQFALPTGAASPLDLVFEVDVRDSVRRRGAHARHA